MRRLVHQRHGAKLLHHGTAFFEHVWPDGGQRQSLIFQNIHVTRKTEGELAYREPVWTLAVVAEQRHVHLAEQFANKRRPEFRMMKEEPGTARTRSGRANVACEDFPLPFRIEQIPVGFKLLWVDERGVIGNPAV